MKCAIPRYRVCPLYRGFLLGYAPMQAVALVRIFYRLKVKTCFYLMCHE